MRFELRILLSILLILLFPGLAEGELSFTMSGNNLYTIDLETGELELFVATAPGTHAHALTLTPAGRLLALALSPAQDSWQIHEIDLHSGANRMLGSFAREHGFVWGLEFAPDGRLWASTGSVLHQIDPTTGAILDTLHLEREIVALAARSDDLYALTLDADLGHWIERVDVEGEALERISVLDIYEAIDDASFDSTGRLRLSARAGSILAVVARVFFQIDDLRTGEWRLTVTKAFHFTDPLAGIGSLAVLPAAASSVLEIPTLDEVGMAIFGALIAIMALFALRRWR